MKYLICLCLLLLISCSNKSINSQKLIEIRKEYHDNYELIYWQDYKQKEEKSFNDLCDRLFYKVHSITANTNNIKLSDNEFNYRVLMTWTSYALKEIETRNIVEQFNEWKDYVKTENSVPFDSGNLNPSDFKSSYYYKKENLEKIATIDLYYAIYPILVPNSIPPTNFGRDRYIENIKDYTLNAKPFDDPLNPTEKITKATKFIKQAIKEAIDPHQVAVIINDLAINYDYSFDPNHNEYFYRHSFTPIHNANSNYLGGKTVFVRSHFRRPPNR